MYVYVSKYKQLRKYKQHWSVTKQMEKEISE